jgi:hypothetical protein
MSLEKTLVSHIRYHHSLEHLCSYLDMTLFIMEECDWLLAGLFSPHMHATFHLLLHLLDPWRLVTNFEGPLEAMTSSSDPTSVNEWSLLEYVDSPYPSVLKWSKIVNARDPSNLVPFRDQISPPTFYALLLEVNDSSQTSNQSPHAHQEVSDQAIPRYPLLQWRMSYNYPYDI